MLKSTIGENAGLIWQLLNKETEKLIRDLQKQSCLTVNDFNMAIGWLSRENKIHFLQNENELYVCLIE